MAVDVSEPFVSPRISFSYDLNSQSTEITTTTAGATAVTTTFDFCVSVDLLQQITSADELFYDGVILPTQIRKPVNHCAEPKTAVSENEDMHVHRKRLKELLSDNDEEHKQEKASSISFWKFARSTSLNVDNGRGSKRLFRSLSLKRLLRSNSTDSALNPKGNDAPAVIEKLNSGKEPAKLPRCSRGDNVWRRSVTKKNSGDGIKVNPILNIPPAYNMNFVGSGSVFCKPKTKTK
ncbi:hypothetical protein L2E82_13826 [Cichorium intybus]|uniref:Uncharacterized protein n=1 Tax=Cichorium intybus TaxID=13427 RepID=A0ACB9EXZ4_CICIN|nr:hypothetical protein L1887_33468 [Cichorium endivia]KAI3763829.1 hypothetical protein L2E82_13826 [Cichorium intybus]